MEVADNTGALSIQIVLLGRDVSEANVKGKEGQQQQLPSQLQIQVNAGATQNPW